MMRKIDFMVQIAGLPAIRTMKKGHSKINQVVQSSQGRRSVDLMDADFCNLNMEIISEFLS